MIGRSLSDERPVYAEVFVNQNVSQSDNVWPRDGVVTRRDFRSEPRDRLADCRQLVGDRIAESLICQEFPLRLSRDSSRDPVQSFQGCLLDAPDHAA